MFKKQLVGVFGQPVDENPSVAMVQAAFDHHGMDWQYLTIEVAPDNLGAAVQGASAMGFAGFNCTIPHKVAVMDHLDEIAPSASLIQAVNCVVRKGDRLIGENTDGRGLVRVLAPVMDPRGKNIAMFGAGGAARAIGVELALAGASTLTLFNRGQVRGEALVAQLNGADIQNHAPGFKALYQTLDLETVIPPGTDIVINATSVGLYPNVLEELPLDYGTLASSMVAIDVIPNPPNTAFLENARKAGCKTIDGLEMLVEQGRIGVELWSGTRPHADVMRKGLENALGQID